jgi:hypothetical protein
VTAQAATTSFSGLTPSQSIPAGTATITLSGVIGSGTNYPPSGEMVSITINGVMQSATIGVNGVFSTSFNTANIPASATAYPITYNYGGDTNYAPATDSSTALTVAQAMQTVMFTTAPPVSAVYNSTFPVAASASSGLPVSIMVGGSCSISGSTVKMTSGTGSCTVTASQAGTTNYTPASKVATVSAQKAMSTSSISSLSPNPSNMGQAVTASFSVTGTTVPTGSVTVSASTGESCSSSLNAAGTGSCNITFTTSGPRNLTASYGGDSNFTGSTSGIVVQTVNGSSSSSLVISPSSVNFGQVLLGSLAAKSITLSNSGSTAIKITSVALSKTGVGDTDDFYQVNLCPASLAAGKSCIIEVAFAPDGDEVGGATSSTSLLITDSAAGSPQSVSLSAVIIHPVASLSAYSLNFGSQKVGSTSASKTVTVTNTGSTPLILNSVTISGNFALAKGTTCSASTTLAPKGQCYIAVTFTPSTKGAHTGAVTITDNALIKQQLIALIGNGK